MPNLEKAPVAIQLAQKALEILAAEDALLTAAARKKLPGFALRLAAAGEEVTVERLLENARAGEIDRLPEPQQKLKTYAEIVAGFRAAAAGGIPDYVEAGDIDGIRRAGRTDYMYLLSRALTNGHVEVIKYLAEEVDFDVRGHVNEALRVAVRRGQLDIVKYLAEKYSTESGYYDYDAFSMAASLAARGGHLDIVKYFVEERGIAVSQNVLNNTVYHGQLDIVKYFVETCGADVSQEALNNAVCNDHLDIVKYFVEECGADIHDENPSLFKALKYNNLGVAKYFVDEHDADISALPVQEQDKLKNYIAACVAWQKAVHIEPPEVMLAGQDPLFFKPAAYKAVLGMLLREAYGVRYLSFFTAALFGTESRVLQYLEKWGKAGKQPLHDLVQMIRLPEKKTPEMDLKAWGDAVLKCGPSMANLVKFADKLPMPEKSDDGKTWSMRKTREKVAQFAYKRAPENLALSALCMEHAVEEDDFNKALELSQNPAIVKNIPDITIDGAAFDMPGATFHRLATDDVRGLFLGEITDCCQSIGGQGAECAEHGFTSEDGGFYAVENVRGEIIGQSWAWRGKEKELVFDSQETLGQNVSAEQWLKLTLAFKAALEKNPGDVTALYVGKGGATPTSLINAFKKVAAPAVPHGYDGYRDSHEQVVVWQKQGGLNA